MGCLDPVGNSDMELMIVVQCDRGWEKNVIKVRNRVICLQIENSLVF